MIFRNSDGAASRCGGQKVVYSTMRGNSSYRSKDIHQFGYWQREISVMELLSASRTLGDGSDDAWVRLGWSLSWQIRAFSTFLTFNDLRLPRYLRYFSIMRQSSASERLIAFSSQDRIYQKTWSMM